MLETLYFTTQTAYSASQQEIRYVYNIVEKEEARLFLFSIISLLAERRTSENSHTTRTSKIETF